MSPGQKVATVIVTGNTGEILTNKNRSDLDFSKVLFVSWCQMSLQCTDRCIEREVNTYRKNKEFNPVNSCCEILVIGLSSRILTTQITNISNVRDIFEVKPGKIKGL